MVEQVPQLRGRITELKGVPAAQIDAAERVSWVLDGDRGITYAAKPPEGSTVVSGEWWPDNYRGRAARLLCQGCRRWPWPQGRRSDRRQRARPADHRDDRQSARGALAAARHQFRDGVLAQHLCRCALYVSGDAGASGEAANRRRKSPLPARSRRASRRSRRCGCKDALDCD